MVVGFPIFVPHVIDVHDLVSIEVESRDRSGPAEDALHHFANRPDHVLWIQRRSHDFGKKRSETEVIFAAVEDDLPGVREKLSELLGGFDAGKAPSNDDDAAHGRRYLSRKSKREGFEASEWTRWVWTRRRPSSQKYSRIPLPGWKPGCDRGFSRGLRGGTLNEDLVFYTKPDCPLCEKSLPVARELAQRQGLDLRTVSIETDPALRERHGERVPVLEFGGEAVGWGRLSARALEREMSRRRGRRGDESPTGGLEAARRLYFLDNGLPGDGGYSERWVRLSFLGVPLVFPNTEARRRAVRYHDLHHVLTEYRTDWPGEAEVAAWEIASGCRGFVVAWVLNLFAMGTGMVLVPKRTYRAFVRGRHASNFYGATLDDRFLAPSVAGARHELGLTVSPGKTTFRDFLAFAGWATAAIVFVSLPLVVAGWLLFWVA